MGCKWATVQHLHVELWQPQNLTKLSQLQRLPCIRFFLNVSATKKHKGLVDTLDFIKIRQCYQGLHTFSGSVLKSLSKHMFFSRSYCSNAKEEVKQKKHQSWNLTIPYADEVIRLFSHVHPKVAGQLGLWGVNETCLYFLPIYSITWGGSLSCFTLHFCWTLRFSFHPSSWPPSSLSAMMHPPCYEPEIAW